MILERLVDVLRDGGTLHLRAMVLVNTIPTRVHAAFFKTMKRDALERL